MAKDLEKFVARYRVTSYILDGKTQSLASEGTREHHPRFHIFRAISVFFPKRYFLRLVFSSFPRPGLDCAPVRRLSSRPHREIRRSLGDKKSPGHSLRFGFGDLSKALLLVVDAHTGAAQS